MPIHCGPAGRRCDALIYLTAAKAGIPVLTANRDEFDLIQQIARMVSSYPIEKAPACMT
jgi:hypothetical protein